MYLYIYIYRNNGRVRGRGEGRMQNTNRYESNDNYGDRYGSSSEDLPDVPPEWLSVSSNMDRYNYIFVRL
jgi:hypothetical protein